MSVTTSVMTWIGSRRAIHTGRAWITSKKSQRLGQLCGKKATQTDSEWVCKLHSKVPMTVPVVQAKTVAFCRQIISSSKSANFNKPCGKPADEETYMCKLHAKTKTTIPKISKTTKIVVRPQAKDTLLEPSPKFVHFADAVPEEQDLVADLLGNSPFQTPTYNPESPMPVF